MSFGLPRLTLPWASRVVGLFTIVLLGVCPSAATAQTPSPTQPSSRQDAPARRGHPANLVGHGGPIKAIAVDAASSVVLTGAFDNAIMLWQPAADGTSANIGRFDRHNGGITAVAFVPASASDPRAPSASDPSASAVLASPRFAIAAGDDMRVTLWDLQTRTEAAVFTGHTGKIVSVAPSRDGRRLLSASWDRSARLWDVTAADPPIVFTGHTGPVNGAVFSNDERGVFTASADGQIGHFDASSGALLRMIFKHDWGLNVLARLPGTELLIVGAVNGSVLLIDGATGTLVRTLKAHDRPVLAVAVHEASGLIATSAGDGVIIVSRARDGTILEEHKHPFGPVWALAFSAAGDALYHGGLDDFATLWTFAPRAAFEAVDTTAYPRRFQQAGQADDIVARGALQFSRKCSICHTVTPDSGNRAGPSLYNIFGRRIASLPGYPFSQPLQTLDIIWSPETLSKLFELGPEIYTPGSKMPLQILSDAADRDDLTAYLAAATQAPKNVAPKNMAPKNIDVTPATPAK